MDKFEKLKTIIEKEYRKKQSEIEKYCLKHEEDFTARIYRKEGWRNCLDYLLSEISLMENVYQYKDND